MDSWLTTPIRVAEVLKRQSKGWRFCVFWFIKYLLVVSIKFLYLHHNGRRILNLPMKNSSLYSLSLLPQHPQDGWGFVAIW